MRVLALGDQRHNREPQVVVCGSGLPREELRGTVEPNERLGVVARLQMDNAEHVDRVGEIRRAPKHIAIQTFGFAPPARLLQSERRLQLSGKRIVGSTDAAAASLES